MKTKGVRGVDKDGLSYSRIGRKSGIGKCFSLQAKELVI